MSFRFMVAACLSLLPSIASAEANYGPSGTGLQIRSLVKRTVNLTYQGYDSMIEVELPDNNNGRFQAMSNPDGGPVRKMFEIKSDDLQINTSVYFIEPVFRQAHEIDDLIRSQLSIIEDEQVVDEKFLYVGRRAENEHEQVIMVQKTEECSNCFIMTGVMANVTTIDYWKKYFNKAFKMGFPTRSDFLYSKFFNEKNMTYGEQYHPLDEAMGRARKTYQDALDMDRQRHPENYSGNQASGSSTGGSAACPEFKKNRDICYRQWQNIGGGSSGQAGSFKQCYELYNNAMTQANCR